MYKIKSDFSVNLSLLILLLDQPEESLRVEEIFFPKVPIITNISVEHYCRNLRFILLARLS